MCIRDRYQGNEKIATVIDFIIAVMSVAIMVMSYIRTIITKRKMQMLYGYIMEYLF